MDERGLVEKQGMGEFDGEGELNEKKGFKLPRFWWLETYISLWFFCKDMFRTSLSIVTQYDFVTLMRSIFFEDGMEYTRIAKHFQETV